MSRTRRGFLWAMAGGVPAAFWLSAWFGNRAALDYATLDGFDPDQDFDVCIAGSGPAGAVLACELARRGIRVLILEAGLHNDDGPPDPPDLVGFDRRPDGIPAGFTYPVFATRYIGPGGTSNLWGGFCARFLPCDFSLPSASAPRGWPIGYSELAPYYGRAEKELLVAPARSEAAANLIRRLKERGFVFEPQPLSRWGAAPLSVERTHLAELARSASATMVVDARVVRLVSAGDGHISSIEARSSDGVVRHVRARHYVLAVGGIEAPRLLLLSRSREYPAGIGNGYDQVGRHFSEHLQTSMEGRRNEASTGVPGVLAEVYSQQFHEEFKTTGAGGVLLEAGSTSSGQRQLALSPMVEMTSSANNRVLLDPTRSDRFGNPRAAIALTMSQRDVATLDRCDSVMRTIFTGMGLPSSVDTGFTALLHHHMGTCRMSDDPAEGVVDIRQRVHGTDNLYVTGASVFPTSSAVPPTLTIVALTLRLADHLAGVVRRAGGPPLVESTDP